MSKHLDDIELIIPKYSYNVPYGNKRDKYPKYLHNILQLGGHCVFIAQNVRTK